MERKKNVVIFPGGGMEIYRYAKHSFRLSELYVILISDNVHRLKQQQQQQPNL